MLNKHFPNYLFNQQNINILNLNLFLPNHVNANATGVQMFHRLQRRQPNFTCTLSVTGLGFLMICVDLTQGWELKNPSIS